MTSNEGKEGDLSGTLRRVSIRFSGLVNTARVKLEAYNDEGDRTTFGWLRWHDVSSERVDLIIVR